MERAYTDRSRPKLLIADETEANFDSPTRILDR